jgi:hypothetical protein
VAAAVGVVVPGSALLGLAVGVGPLADLVGTGRALAGVVVGEGVGVADVAGMALADARDGDGSPAPRRGDGAGRGRVPAGPTGAIV